MDPQFFKGLCFFFWIFKCMEIIRVACWKKMKNGNNDFVSPSRNIYNFVYVLCKFFGRPKCRVTTVQPVNASLRPRSFPRPFLNGDPSSFAILENPVQIVWVRGNVAIASCDETRKDRKSAPFLLIEPAVWNLFSTLKNVQISNLRGKFVINTFKMPHVGKLNYRNFFFILQRNVARLVEYLSTAATFPNRSAVPLPVNCLTLSSKASPCLAALKISSFNSLYSACCWFSKVVVAIALFGNSTSAKRLVNESSANDTSCVMHENFSRLCQKTNDRDASNYQNEFYSPRFPRIRNFSELYICSNFRWTKVQIKMNDKEISILTIRFWIQVGWQ